MLVFQQFVRADVLVAFAEHNEVGAARLSFEGERAGRTLARGLGNGLASDVCHDDLRACGEAVVERDSLAVAVVTNRAVVGRGGIGDACLCAFSGRPA